MIKGVLSIILLLSGWSQVAFASTSQDPCHAAGNDITASNECVDEQMSLADRRLQLAYESALIRIEDEQHGLSKLGVDVDLAAPFRAAQQDWRSYVGHQCDFTGKISTSRPWQRVKIQQCKLDFFLQRIDYLNQLLTE